MNLDWALIATHVEPQANGAFAILGAGTEALASIERDALPEELRAKLTEGAVGSDVSFHVVARFRVPRHELTRPHIIEGDVVDADGTSVSKLTFNVPPLTLPIAANQATDVGIVAHLQVRIAPKRFGAYVVALFADTASVKQIPFTIVPMQQMPGNFAK